MPPRKSQNTAPSPSMRTRGQANNAVLMNETLTLLPSDNKFETQHDAVDNIEETINEEGEEEEEDDDEDGDDEEENRRWTAKIFGDTAATELQYSDDFGLCTCGIPQTKTIPCEHMVAVVQAQVVPGLTQLNIMPTWCSTAVWRKQYPKGTSIRADFTTNQLTEMHEPNKKLRCCPKAAAPNKSGAPKKIKRVKGPLEKRNKKRKVKIGLVDVDVDEDSIGFGSPGKGEKGKGEKNGDGAMGFV